MNISIEPLNEIQPMSELIQFIFVSSNVELIDVNVKFCTKLLHSKLSENYDNHGENFLVTDCRTNK